MRQCLNGLAPSYLATDYIAISSMPGRRQLQSAASETAIYSKNQDYDIRTKVVQGVWSHNLEWSACQIEGFVSEQKLFQKIA